MDKWVVYALISMIFAGFTSVIAKMGLAGISGVFVSLLSSGFAEPVKHHK